MVDISNSPYNDRFNTDKEYTQLLFQPNRPAQASELTEMQSIQSYYLGRVGNSLFTDGNIQEGMDFIVNDYSSSITVNDGYVYLAGKIRKFNQQTIDFITEGEFTVQVKLEQEVVTSEQDSELLDMTLGVPSYMSQGADRLKETVQLTTGEPDGADIYEFRDGNLFKQSSTPEIAKLNDILAERTFDESGSYKVNGFTMYTNPDETNQNNLNIVVDAGRAYVQGYQIIKPTATKISVPKAQGTRKVLSEGFYYSNVSRRGKLGSSPVKSVERVTAQVPVSRQTINHGSVANSTDSLPHSSVIQVKEVWQETAGQVTARYSPGTDFVLTNGNSISWAPENGSEPNAGSSYYVSYTYNKTLTEGIDYRVVEEGSIDQVNTYIDFNGMTGALPESNSLVNVDYTYYLAREDLVLLDKDGEIHVKQGEYANFNNVKPPIHLDPYTLVLGTVQLLPNSLTSVIVESATENLTMADLQKLKSRIENLEYNQALFELDNEAMSGTNPNTLRGIFSDGFMTTDKADTTHPDMTAAYSFDDAEITLPYSDITIVEPTYLDSTSTSHTWGRLVTAPFTERIGLQQTQATTSFNINPYNVFNNRAKLMITPSEDNWVEESTTTVIEDDYSSNTDIRIRRWWAHNGDQDLLDISKNIAQFITLDEGQAWDMRGMTAEGTGLTKNVDKFMNGDMKHFDADGNEVGWWNWDEAHGRTGTILKDGGSRTLDNAITYTRQIDIQFKGEGFTPNTDNLYITFDGIRVPITPHRGYSKGSQNGTIRANAEGFAEGTFTIPAGVRTGARQVFLQNQGNTASSVFYSQGILRTVEDVILRSHVTVDTFDPLAQGFQFTSNQVISSIDLYFMSKDNTESVTVQVRNITESGFPGKTIFAETRLSPSEVNVSSNGTLATNVTFDDPLVVNGGQEYAITLLAATTQYTVAIAERGGTDMVTGTQVTKNPYNSGVMFSSSNASAWTIHQDADIKFKINVAEFNPSALLRFDPINDISADAVLLLATYLTPENTGALFEARMVLESEPSDVDIESKPWLPIANYVEIDLNNNARVLEIRAHFSTNNNMSPLLSLHDIKLNTFLSALEGSYVSRTISMEQAPFNKLSISLEVFEPAGTTAEIRYSTDEGTTWNSLDTSPVRADVGDGFERIMYEEKIGEGNVTFDSIKWRIDFTTSNSFQRPRARKFMTRTINE